MHKSVLLLALIVITGIINCNAQTKELGIKWSKFYGGDTDREIIQPPHKVSLIDRDGNYLMAGNSYSRLPGNHPNQYGWPSEDILIVKLDSQKNTSWSVSLGGSEGEEFASLQLAHDNGYIVAGSTGSVDGDVTGNKGGGDIWVIHLSNQGVITWQKCLGGTGIDQTTCLERTKDGYILVGNTTSSDGDVSGYHPGQFDIWIAKLDKNANIIWQKCLGGSGDDRDAVVKQTLDGGFIVTGTTNSVDGDVQGLHGNKNDIWVVKLDANGNIEWQKCLGGSKAETPYDVELTPLGGYIIAGETFSSDGDVNGLHPTDTTYDTNDGWVVSLSSTGVIGWQQCFGKSLSDALYDIVVLPDQSFLAVGETSYTGYDRLYGRAGRDTWIVNFKPYMGLIWEKAIDFAGDYYTDYGTSLVVTPNGNIVVSGSTSKRWYDIFIAEMGSFNTIAGYVFYDANSDGIQNSNEPFFDKIIIKSARNQDTVLAIPQKGYYAMNVDTGAYLTSVIPYNNYYTITPVGRTSTFNNYFNTDTIRFAVQPRPNLRDVAMNLIPITVARPGFAVQYKMIYQNVGTNVVNTGQVKLIKDKRLVFTSAMPAATIVSGDTLTWDYSYLQPNVESTIILNFTASAPPTTNNGDTLKSKAWIIQDGVDIAPANDTAVLRQIVIGSFDPNDKTEAHGGIISPGQISGADPLTYIIRFQNTGTDTAFNIAVRDTLDNRLNWNSLQMISSSHAYQLLIQDGNKLTWQFNNIKLPHTGIDEPGSHGYIAYSVKPKTNSMVGDTIKNKAGIYFDYNLPIITNTENTIVWVLTPLPVTFLSFKAILKNTVVEISWKTSIEENLKQFEVQRSDNGIDFTTIGMVGVGKTLYLFTDKEPLEGYNYYRIKSVDRDGSFTYSGIALVNVKNEADIISSVYPNPVTGISTLKLQGKFEGDVLVQVLDQQGRHVISKKYSVGQGNEIKLPLELVGLTKGNYLLKIFINSKTFLHKLVIL